MKVFALLVALAACQPANNPAPARVDCELPFARLVAMQCPQRQLSDGTPWLAFCRGMAANGVDPHTNCVTMAKSCSEAQSCK